MGLVSAVVPTFTFKVQSQFDFIKNVGGAFVSPPFPEKHLWQMSFTTDLRKAIASIKSRADAANLLPMTKKAVQGESVCKEISLPDIAPKSLLYYALPSKVAWSFEQCDTGTEPNTKKACQMNGI
jgi:hypothetical protein